jgi:chaperonin GroEL
MAGVDLVQLMAGIKEAAGFANTVLDAMTLPVETPQILERVAWISSNNDAEVAKALTDACLAVGKDGTVVIEDGEACNIELIFKEGMELTQGPSSTHFLKGNVERALESCLVAVVPQILSRPEDVISIMEEASQFPDNPLLIIAERIEGTALSTMVMNDDKGVVTCVGMDGNGLGMHRKEVLKDIAALAGCGTIDPNMGFDHTKFESEWFGSFRKMTIGTNKSVIHSYEEAKDSVGERVVTLKAELAASTHDYDRDRLSERIAKLQGGFCVVRAGGVTETAIKERRARIEDTLGAVQSALREGVLPGGGTAYLTAYQDLYERGFEEGAFGVGQKALADSLLSPLMTIAENSQMNGHVIVHMVLTARKNIEESEDAGWIGWDAVQDKIRD